jgi:hypothetical protein
MALKPEKLIHAIIERSWLIKKIKMKNNQKGARN